ncbi:MAG: hypothetical protein ABI408_11185 [Gemmatimonadaceae bacterium]
MSRLTFAASFLLAIPCASFGQQAAQALLASSDTGPSADVIFETKDAATLTAGLSPLTKAAIPNGEREVRIWYSGFGNPQYLVIIRQKGAETTGRLLLWWDQYYESNPASADTRVDNFVRGGFNCGPISKRDSHFGEDRWISSVCEAKLKGTPDWKAFLSAVEAHALPQTSATVDSVDQGANENWGITVERKSGVNYGVSYYHTALTFGAPEPGRGPKLQDMVNALASTVRREPKIAAQH